MRREKHITIKATLLALISVVAGTYMLYNIDNFINLLAHSEVLKEMNPSMVIFLKDMSRIALLLMFILSMLTFGKNYDQLSFLNIFISFMLGYSFGTLCGLIRYYFFSQYYGTVGMRIVELILIFFMFAVIKVNTKITKKGKIKFTNLDNFLLYRIVKVFHFI